MMAVSVDSTAQKAAFSKIQFAVVSTLLTAIFLALAIRMIRPTQEEGPRTKKRKAAGTATGEKAP